jgi:two-component system, OmpR family, response regulator
MRKRSRNISARGEENGGLEVSFLLSFTEEVPTSGKAIDLRPKEFLLLEYLVRNVNRQVSRTMILEHVWNPSFEGLTNVVDVYISALRSKVDRDFPQKLIQTNRGIGYTFTCSNAVLKLHPSVASASARSAAASTASSTQSSAKEGVVGSERQ